MSGDINITQNNAEDIATAMVQALERMGFSGKSSPAELTPSQEKEVEQILDETIEELKNWSLEMEVSPTIKKLKKALDEIRKEEISRYMGKMTEVEQELMDKVTKRIVQKVIKLPVLQLKAACKRGEAETLVEVLNDLFNLEKDELISKG